MRVCCLCLCAHVNACGLYVRACCLRVCSGIPGAAVTLASRENGPQDPCGGRSCPDSPGPSGRGWAQHPASSARRSEMITGPFALCENWKSVSWKRGLSEEGVRPACWGRALHTLAGRAGPAPRGTGRHLRNAGLRGGPGAGRGCGRARTRRWCPRLGCVLRGLAPLWGASAVLNRAQGSLLPVT